ncbi:4a-hydroxytetrahydrobiopterin dehydratase [Bounagaea algeriensis]
MAELLSTDAVHSALADLGEWQYTGTSLTRTWQRKGFNGAVQVANVVAFAANELNHHPDITVHDYNRVTVTTTTHDAGGVTEGDLALVRRINGMVEPAS